MGRQWLRSGSAACYAGKVARYVGKEGGVRPLWEDGTLPGRCFYVSRRLTSQTGCTVRMLRRRGAAWCSWGLAVPIGRLGDWVDFERALGRDLGLPVWVSVLYLQLLQKKPRIREP